MRVACIVAIPAFKSSALSHRIYAFGVNYINRTRIELCDYEMTMACESDKCDKYGLHHDYKDGIEIRKCFACERDSNRFTLLPMSLDVTLSEYLELLVSPKRCLAIGLDITTERMKYQNEHEWHEWPPLPPIDPTQEIDIEIR